MVAGDALESASKERIASSLSGTRFSRGMNRKQATLSLILAALSLGIAAWWLFRDDPSASTRAMENPVVPAAPLPPLDGSAPNPSRDVVDVRTAAELGNEWELARATSLRALDAQTLQLEQAAADLLELTPEQVAAANEALSLFVETLVRAEIALAYVIDGEEGREIVVPKFDRKKLYAALQGSLSQRLGPGIAEFIVERLRYDSILGATNSEVRLTVGKDDRVIFTRDVLRPDAFDPDVTIEMRPPGSEISVAMAATAKATTNYNSRREISPRLRQLIDAAGILPKRDR